MRRLRRWLIRVLGGRPQHPLAYRQQGELWLRQRMQRLTRQDLEDMIVQMAHEERAPHDWFGHYLVADRENERLKQLLRSDYHTNKDLNRALHMSDLEEKNRRLKREVREMQVKAERFNDQLYATGLIVRCTGCEPGQPFEGEHLTEERVQEVEVIAQRLRVWFTNHQWRLAMESRDAE